MEMSDKAKVIGIIALVIVINVVLWKCGMPTKWDIFNSIVH